MAANYPFANNVRAQSDYAQSATAHNDYSNQDRYDYHDDPPVANDPDYRASSHRPYGEAYDHDRSLYSAPEAIDNEQNHIHGQDKYDEKASAPSALQPSNAASARNAGVLGDDAFKEDDHHNSRYGSKQRDSVFTPDDRHVFRRRSCPVRILRTLFCLFIWAVIIFLCVVLLVVTFALPPNVALLSINVPTAGDFTVSGSSFSANGSLNLAVSNPNSFSAQIKSITANVYDAMLAEQVSIGNGSLVDQEIAANANTTIVFPFDIAIDLSSSGQALITDVIQQCGIGTSSSSGRSLTALIDVRARITVLSISVSVPISRNTTFACPTAQLESIIETLTGTSTAAAAAAALGSLSSRRSLSLALPQGIVEERAMSSGATAATAFGEESDVNKRGGFQLTPAEVSSDWEINKRELFRQLLQPWFPRAMSALPAGSGSGDSGSDHLQSRGLVDL